MIFLEDKKNTGFCDNGVFGLIMMTIIIISA